MQLSEMVIAGEPVDDLDSLVVFRPGGERGRRVYDRVVAGLAESLDEVASGLAPHTDLPLRLFSLGQRLRESGGHKIPPAFVCRYFRLLEAVEADDVDAAIKRFRELDASLDAEAPAFLADWGQLPAPVTDLYSQALTLDPTTVLALTAPDAEAARVAGSCAEQAFGMIEIASPELGAELRALLAQLVFVQGTVKEGGHFDGATSFHAWGALFLNAEEHRTRIDMVDGLAHESGHALLYGLSLGRPFVNNPPSERHRSPLRPDPRPLDGIFHATYVSARMHFAHAQLLAAEAEGRLDLSSEEAEHARSSMAQSAVACRGGLSVIEEHAKLTLLGSRVISNAQAYIQSVT
jgi:HEXXH motif-containing protein